MDIEIMLIEEITKSIHPTDRLLEMLEDIGATTAYLDGITYDGHAPELLHSAAAEVELGDILEKIFETWIETKRLPF